MRRCFAQYRDLSSLGEAAVRLDVRHVYRRVVAARESTASNADAQCLGTVLHIQPLAILVILHSYSITVTLSSYRTIIVLSCFIV